MILEGITYKNFESSTKLTFARRSSEFRNVLAWLEQFENHGRHYGENWRGLRAVVNRWLCYRTDEYRRRNEASHGLCSLLASRLALRIPLVLARPYNDAFQIVRRGDSNKLHVRLDAHLQNRPGADSTALIIIDMQSNHVEPGFATQYDLNNFTVIDNQLAVINRARARNIPVFNISPAQHGRGGFVLGPGGQYLPRAIHPALTAALAGYAHLRNIGKPSQNALDRTDLLARLTALCPLNPDGVTRNYNALWVYVMGYHVNVCVKATIFGNHMAQGLLQRGFKVVTARNALAGDYDDPLDRDYGALLV
ncbi:MAG: isochorismatase family protein [Desulfobulbaceae bacterium]|nr:isochorismatase family protein [Desulfobulbaceae bacterium]